MINKMMITAAAALALVAGNAQAQNYGTVENFYRANIDVDNSQYAGRAVNPGYWLVSQAQWADVDSRWTGGDYVRLGISSWESDNTQGGGIPLKDWALAYAKTVGADVVIYSIHTGDKYDWTQHDVAFYARTQQGASLNRLNNSQATTAMNRLQDAFGRPRVSSVWYNRNNDTYNWVGPKFHRQMSQSATQFMSEIAPWLF
jgi:hypothetical protein